MQFVNKVEAAGISEVERLIKERLRKNYAQHQLPLPKIKLVDNKSAKWLGRTTFRSREPGNTVIEIQKRIINDKDTLTRVIDHELVHHYDFLRNPTDPAKKNVSRNPHDQFFMNEARRINTKMGKDWITKKSDQTYVTDALDKDITVVLYNNNGKYGFAFTFQPNQEQKEAIQGLLKTRKARVLKTRDGRFAKGPELTAVPQFAVPKDPKMQDYLKRLYQKASKTLV